MQRNCSKRMDLENEECVDNEKTTKVVVDALTFGCCRCRRAVAGAIGGVGVAHRVMSVEEELLRNLTFPRKIGRN